jgi:hypothetical protein
MPRVGAETPLLSEQAARRSVRTTEPEVQTLLDSASARSATFRSLIAALNDSDVIVYVETSVIRAAQLDGHLVHQIVTTATRRYLRLRLNPNGLVEQRIGVIAHELQHALEIAQAPSVGRSETVQSLFELIGFTSGAQCGDCYETTRAREVEHLVRVELRASRATLRQNQP